MPVPPPVPAGAEESMQKQPGPAATPVDG
jgi:hypothetical protein